MKRLFTLLLLVASFSSAFAGGFDPYKIDPDFEKAIKPVLSGLDSSGGDAYAGLLETFKSISDQYPREWRGYYWQAFANIRKAELSEGQDKEMALTEAERLINRAEMFIKENTELYLLRAWMLHEKIAIDPSVRQLKFGQDEKWYLDQVYMKDQSNPRYFFLKGKWSEGDTTEEGKKITLRYYESANILFSERPKSRFYAEPDWGRGETLIALGVMQPAPLDEPLAEEGGEAPAGEESEEAAEEIPESMRGAVLPGSLTDENAGEIRVDNSGDNKGEFKLFNFKKPAPPTVQQVGAEDAAEEAPAESKDSKKDKESKGKSSDKKDKSKKKVKSPEEESGKSKKSSKGDKKSDKKSKGKDDSASSAQGTEIEVTENTEVDIIPASEQGDAKEAKKKKEKESKKGKDDKKSKDSKKKKK